MLLQHGRHHTNLRHCMRLRSRVRRKCSSTAGTVTIPHRSSATGRAEESLRTGPRPSPFFPNADSGSGNRSDLRSGPESDADSRSGILPDSPIERDPSPRLIPDRPDSRSGIFHRRARPDSDTIISPIQPPPDTPAQLMIGVRSPPVAVPLSHRPPRRRGTCWWIHRVSHFHRAGIRLRALASRRHEAFLRVRISTVVSVQSCSSR
jgi:hypothetical protein